MIIPKGPINNIPALVQVMAWCRPGDKPLSGPMLTQFTDAYIATLGGVALNHWPLRDLSEMLDKYSPS